MAESPSTPTDGAGVAAEYLQACAHAALFDRSHHGKIEVAGADARTFLHNLCTSDVKGLPPGGSIEAFLTTNKAKVIAHLHIHHRGTHDRRDVFWIDAGPGMGPKTAAYLDRFHISEDVEVIDRTEAYAQFHLAGPAATALAEELAKQDATLTILRSLDPLGVPGFDLVMAKDRAPVVRQRCLSAGATPAGEQAYEILRVEAGTPAYAHEMDEERFVVELGRTHAVSYSKGCYLGQEPIVMARDRGHVNRLLRGLKLSGANAVPPGAKVFRDGKEVGQVTSSVVSPRRGAIALGYLMRGHQEPGTVVEIDESGRTQHAEVTALPFS